MAGKKVYRDRVKVFFYIERDAHNKMKEHLNGKTESAFIQAAIDAAIKAPEVLAPKKAEPPQPTTKADRLKNPFGWDLETFGTKKYVPPVDPRGEFYPMLGLKDKRE